MDEEEPFLAPTEIRKNVYVHFFQYVEDGSPYGVSGSACRKVTRNGCTVTGPMNTLLAREQGFQEATGNLIIAVPTTLARSGQSLQSGQPEQPKRSGA